MEQQLSNITVTPLGIKSIEQLENKIGYFYEIKLLKSSKKTFRHHVILVDLSFNRIEQIGIIGQVLKSILNQMKRVKNQIVSILISGECENDVWITQYLKCEEIGLRQGELESRINQLLAGYFGGRISNSFKMAVELMKERQSIDQHLVLLTNAQWDTLDCSMEDEITHCLDHLNPQESHPFQLDLFLLNNPLQYPPLLRLIQLVGGQIYDVKTKNQLLKQLKQCLIRDSQPILIKNLNLFSIHEHRLYIEKEWIEISSQEPNIWVVFGEPLVINQHEVQGELEEVDELLLTRFRYSYSIWLLRQRKVEEATLQLAKMGQVRLYQQVLNGYTDFELYQSLNQLNRIYEAHRTKPFKETFVHKPLISQVEPLCLLEILRLIMLDEDSNLWWDYSNLSNSSPNLMTTSEGRYHFRRSLYDLGRVTRLQVGSKKMNIGLTIKVRGQVEDSTTGLKLDAHIFRTVPLIVDGRVMVKELPCTLSKALKKMVKEAKLVKKQWSQNGREMTILNLEKIKVTNNRMSLEMDDQDVAVSLYEIQCLGCQRYVLKRLIHEFLSLKSSSKAVKSSEQLKKSSIRRQYGVSETGLYLPLTTDETEHQGDEMHPVSIIEWKIEGFVKKVEQQKAYEKYMKVLNELSSSPIDWLFNELEKVSVNRQVLVDQVNMKRILTHLRGHSLFNWDDEFESKKVQMDARLKRNVIQGGKMKVSIKKINQITIRENAYTVWVRCT